MSRGGFEDWDDDAPHWRGMHDKPRGTNPDVPVKPDPKNYGSTQEIDLDKALADNYAEAEAYRNHLTQNSEHFQPNHVTGAMTSVNRILEQITKMQEKVQNLARLQALENAVIELMKVQSADIRDAFFADLKQRVGEIQ